MASNMRRCLSTVVVFASSARYASQSIRSKLPSSSLIRPATFHKNRLCKFQMGRVRHSLSSNCVSGGSTRYLVCSAVSFALDKWFVLHNNFWWLCDIDQCPASDLPLPSLGLRSAFQLTMHGIGVTPLQASRVAVQSVSPSREDHIANCNVGTAFDESWVVHLAGQTNRLVEHTDG